MTLESTTCEAGVRFGVRVKPRSSRSELLGIRNGALEVALRAPPVEGAANEELVRLLARALGVRKSALTIAAGAHGRNKVIEVAGIDRGALELCIARELNGA